MTEHNTNSIFSNTIVIDDNNNNNNNNKYNYIVSNKNKSIKSKNVNSPQTFFKNLYDDVPLVKKRQKVSDDDFEIPEMNEYSLFIKNNYNVKQLKKICKYYNLKISGNKSELYHRIYNNMKYSVPSIQIQKNWRGYRFRKFLYARGPAVIKRKLCLNTEDFITLDSIESIPIEQFFSFEQSGHIYGFDLCSLINYIKKHSDKKPNPYNRESFPQFEKPPFPCVPDNKYTKTITQYIVKLVQISKRKFNMNVNISIEDDTENMSKEQRLKHRILILFQKINELGHYTDPSWFMNLNRIKLTSFIRDLHDIWFYRSQLNEISRMRVVPPTGNPFINIINVFQTNLLSMHCFQEGCVGVMERMINSGMSQDLKYLGSSLVLTALTLSSEEAANSMPWFYQSVA